MASITVREYNSESGALISNVSSLNFGRLTAGTRSGVKVLDVVFNEVSEVGAIKIGLISSGNLTVNPNPQDINDDGSAGNGFFGIESSAGFDAVKAASPLTRFFAGINGTISADNAENVSVDNRASNLSNYIYLDVEIGAANVGQINGAYKVFFDYS